MPLAAGTRIGPYEIVGWLGAGGMGEVYRGRDPRLARDVAIKLIPERLVADRSRLHRFEQEARAAGQLNHPNILTVFDVGEHAGTPYIVSELLEGESLRELLQGGSMPSRKAIDYARQIADGLAAAHDKGIVHRDLKPDNLFLTSDGRVKILDFGIAKLTRPRDDGQLETGMPTETDPGLVVGTVRYMSPEQVRGDVVDARSDLFSLGLVLFEMLTGRPAFSRETPPETMTAILKEHPPELTGRIVARCLEKTREARFQSARDLAFGLEVLSGTTGTAPVPAAAAPRRLSTQARVARGAGLLLLAAAAGWLSRGAASPPFENPLLTARISRFTNWEGIETGADISPDGRFVTFLSDKDGAMHIWTSQVGTGSYRNLTPRSGPLENASPLRNVGFSEDAAGIWFAIGREAQLQRVPLGGGPPQAFLIERAKSPAWSRDGKRLAFFRNTADDPLHIADRTGADAKPIEITPSDPKDWAGVGERDIHNHNPVWSVDDQWIYFVHGFVYGLNQNDDLDIWRVRPSGGAPERMTRHHTAIVHVTPLDAGRLIYAARAPDGSGPSLWMLDVATKTSHRLTSGLERYTSIAASHDGKRLVATVDSPAVSLWALPISDRVQGESDVQPYRLPAVRALAPRFGGSQLFFLSAQGTGDGLWRWPVQGETALESLKGSEEALSDAPAPSRDGKRVAVVLRREGGRQLAVMAADGTGLQRLAETIDVQGTGAWSPDGQWIVIGGREKNTPGLFKIPLNGGPPERLVDGVAVNPIWSADDLIVYAVSAVAGQAALRGIRPDRTPVELPAVLARPACYRFLPNANALVYLDDLKAQDFWVIDLDTKAKRQLARLTDRARIFTFDVTPDGRQIVFDRLRENSDVVLIELR
jgi:serine/threonine protein kinase